ARCRRHIPPRESARRCTRGARSPARRRRAPRTTIRGSSRAGDGAADPAARTTWPSPPTNRSASRRGTKPGTAPRRRRRRSPPTDARRSRRPRSPRAIVRIEIRRRSFAPEESLGDDFVLNLARAFEDAEDARVAPEALRRIFARISVAAEDLHHLRRHALGHLGGEHLGHAGLEIRARAGVLLLARVVGELPRRLDLD